MSDREPAEPEMLSATEGLDEDELRLDPLEEGADPPERWSPATEGGTTAAEVRAGESLDQKLSQEQPDVELGEVAERPIAATPALALDDSIDDLTPDFEPVAPAEPERPRHADMDPGEQADQAGGSVAEAIRTAEGD